MIENWLILGGCPRSGTTGLMNSLNNDPRIGLIPEYHSLRFFNSIERVFSKERSVKRKAWVSDINLNKRGKETVLTETFLKFVPQKEKSFQAIVDTVFKTTHGEECTIYGEKYPRYDTFNIDEMNHFVKNLKIIHISRSPYDVLLSYFHRRTMAAKGKDTWNYNHPLDGYRHWISAWGLFERMRANKDVRIIHLKYEDLLDNEDWFGEVSNYLNLDSPNFLKLVSKTKANKMDHIAELISENEQHIEYIFGDMIKDWKNENLDVLLEKYPSKLLRKRFEKSLKTPYKNLPPMKRLNFKLKRLFS